MEIISNDDFEDVNFDDSPIFERKKSLRRTSATNPNELTITKLTPGVKNPNRVNVYINNAYSFSLDIAQIVEFGIKIKRVITEQELKDFQHASDYGKLYQSSLEWVLSRPHSIKETYDHLRNKKYKRDYEHKAYTSHLEKLKSDPEYQERFKAWHNNNRKFKKDHKEVSFEENNENEYGAKNRKSPFPHKPAATFTDEDIELIVKTFIERGYLDDQHFAEYYIENRHTKKGISSKRLKQELAQKGIDPITIEQTLHESDRNDYDEIQKLIAKKRKRYDDQKLIAYLMRQGFQFDDAKNAVEQFSNSEDY